MIKVTNNDLSVLDSAKVQVLDFNASWCGPCKALKPRFEEWEKELTDVQFADVDADENEKLCEEFGIRNMPTAIVRKGDKMERIVGGINKDKIIEGINKVSE